MSFYTINKVANTFLGSLEEAGYKGMLYGSKNYLENIWDTDYDVWLAHYSVSKTSYEGNYVMWQLCNTGSVNGISTAVDIDVMYE